MIRLTSNGVLMAIVVSAALSSQSATPSRSTPTAVPVYVGCFSSYEPLIKQDTYVYQSSGHCWGVCSAIEKPVLGLSNGDLCWCGDELPWPESKVNESKCSTPCAGYALEDCGGGTKYFTVWLSGTESTVPTYNGSSEAQSSLSSSSTSRSTATLPTKSATSANGPSTTTALSSTSSSTASLANKKLQRTRSHDQQRTILGVVLGLTAFTAIVITALALWYCIWRPRKRARRSLRGDKASSMSEGALMRSGDAASIDSASTYSSQRSFGFVERAGQAIAAMQVALSPNARAGSNRFSPSHEAPIALPHSAGNQRSASINVDSRSSYFNNERWVERTSIAPISPMMSVAPTFGNTTVKEPKSTTVQVSTDEVVSPTSPRSSGATHKLQRSVVTHYPSWSEVNEFDFSGEVDDPSAGNQRGSWHSWRERKEGRYELA